MSDSPDLTTLLMMAFSTLMTIATLMVEYKAGTITSVRFAERVCQTIDGFVKDATALRAKGDKA